MRTIALALAVITLGACDSGDVPPPGQEPLRASTPQVAADEVVLRGEGLVAGAEAFYFAAGENEVRTALAGVLGKAESDASNDECGAGPMTFVGYPGRLTVNFQDGRLVGWTLFEGGDRISVESDIQVGTPSDTAVEVDGFTRVDDSTLGEEFSIGPNIGGFIEADKVSMLYAGTQCFFR